MWVSVDVGGTNTRVAVSSDGQILDHKEKYTTSQDYILALEKLEQTIKTMVKSAAITGMSIALPGVIDKYRGVLTSAPHLPNWREQPIKQDLHRLFKIPIILENDASLAALAEASLGAGKGYDIVGYLTLSTGVGGAKVIRGSLDPSYQGFEPGHQIIQPHGKLWPYCGQTGCFESVASGTAFEQTYSTKPEDCRDPEIWQHHAKACSIGLINTILLWSPEVLVLGGSLTAAGDQFIGPLTGYTTEGLKIVPAPKIVVSTLGDDNVLLGGLIVQRQMDEVK